MADVELAGQLAEIGVMLMMFGVGLALLDRGPAGRPPHRDPGRHRADRSSHGARDGDGDSGGAGQRVVRWCSAWRSRWPAPWCCCGRWRLADVLSSLNGRIAVGWLVVEDLVVVLILVLLPALAGVLGGTAAHPAERLPLECTWRLTLGKVAAFVALMLIVGRRLLPRLLWAVARTGSRELFTLAVISTAVGVAYLSAELFSVSFALGAFFAGMMMRESSLSHRAAEESLPFRDAFSVLFFVSVGMLFDPHILVAEPLRVVAVAAIIMIGKTVAAIGLVLAFSLPAQHCADGRRQSGPDRRVLLHSGRAWA